ncbi:MAG: tetratricopeptide repeat protein, partial [Chloroflexi bacterium]|nr:tetratricopeptide repeat protein [Chloroflexota bacterium]
LEGMQLCAQVDENYSSSDVPTVPPPAPTPRERNGIYLDWGTMQLRVPKKYRPRKRQPRRLISGRVVWLFIFTFVMAGIAYAMLQNPDPFQDSASGMADSVADRVESVRADMFPEKPTATPDVRQEMIDCDNAYLVGDLQAVIDVCGAALPGRPNDVDLHYRIAYTLVVTSSRGENEARLEEALEMANQTIAADPQSEKGWAVKAMALDWSGEHNLALAAAQRALEINPNSVIAKTHLGNIYRNLGRPELAETSLTEAVQLLETPGVNNETRAQVYRNYGWYLYTTANDFEGALEAYTIARQAMPSHTYIAIEMADVYFLLASIEPNGDEYRGEAFELLEDSLTTAPRDATLLAQLGSYRYREGQVEEAAEMFTRCLDVDPDYITCLSQLGWIQALTYNRYNQAIDYLSLATELGSTNPYDWYLLGRSYFRLQQCDLAAEPLRQGYLLRQEVDSNQVFPDDFITAFRECGLPTPQE